jgi:hypothetical protein
MKIDADEKKLLESVERGEWKVRRPEYQWRPALMALPIHSASFASTFSVGPQDSSSRSA